jgi:hypothetical protein
MCGSLAQQLKHRVAVEAQGGAPPPGRQPEHAKVLLMRVDERGLDSEQRGDLVHLEQPVRRTVEQLGDAHGDRLDVRCGEHRNRRGGHRGRAADGRRRDVCVADGCASLGRPAGGRTDRAIAGIEP